MEGSTGSTSTGEGGDVDGSLAGASLCCLSYMQPGRCIFFCDVSRYSAFLLLLLSMSLPMSFSFCFFAALAVIFFPAPPPPSFSSRIPSSLPPPPPYPPTPNPNSSGLGGGRDGVGGAGGAIGGGLGDTDGRGGSSGGSSSNRVGRGSLADPDDTRARSLSPYAHPRRGAGNAAGIIEAGAPEAAVAKRDRGPTLAIHRAGLGAHLLLPAVSVGAAWLLDLFIRFLENSLEYTAKHHIISGEF